MTRLNSILLTVLVVCALLLVSTQYQARRMHVDIEAAQDAARKLEIEWSQLQLDQASLSKHALIDAAARKDLDMIPANPARTEYITLVPHGPIPRAPPVDPVGASSQ